MRSLSPLALLHRLPSPGRSGFVRPLALLLLAGGLLTALFACADTVAPPEEAEAAVGVVVGSVDNSLTIFEVDDPSRTRTVGLGPDGSPVSVAVRGRLAVVPLGMVPALAVVDIPSATLVRTVALPAGSGATGVDFINDSVAVVANPGLNSVSPVNVLRGTVAPQIPVGRYPQAVKAHAGRVWIVNAELENFVPASPGTLTALDAATLAPVATVPLTGLNPGGVAVGPDGALYVLHSGRFGQADGSVSVVDPASGTERTHLTGFGEFPGSLAFGPAGRLHVASFGYGLAIWNPQGGGAWVRAPGAPGLPDRLASVAGLGFDVEGRLHVLYPDCVNPSVVLRMGGALQVEREIPVGICPIAIAFGEG
jgi:hypothetical protein